MVSHILWLNVVIYGDLCNIISSPVVANWRNVALCGLKKNSEPHFDTVRHIQTHFKKLRNCVGMWRIAAKCDSEIIIFLSQIEPRGAKCE